MPIIEVKVMEKVLSPAEKQAIAEGITEVFAATVGDAARAVTWVVIQDVASGQWTMGGNPVTTDGVLELLGRVPTASSAS
jgi:4-oxalocrotonate tautomerase